MAAYDIAAVDRLDAEGPGGMVRDGLELVTIGAPLDRQHEPPSSG